MVWGNNTLYAFPPFNVIGKILNEIHEDETTVISIVQLRLTQVWSSLAQKLLAENPFLLSSESLVLLQELNLTPEGTQVKNDLNDPPEKFFKSHGLSKEFAEFLLRSWRQSTQWQYGPCIKRWVSGCVSKKTDILLPLLKCSVKTFNT